MPQLLPRKSPKTVTAAADFTNDKTLNLSSRGYSSPLTVKVNLGSSAEVGNREVELRFLDSESNILDRKIAKTTQAASLSYEYLFNVNYSDETTVFTGISTTVLYQMLPDLTLPTSGKIQVLDTANIDASDSLSVTITYLEELKG